MVTFDEVEEREKKEPNPDSRRMRLKPGSKTQPLASPLTPSPHPSSPRPSSCPSRIAAAGPQPHSLLLHPTALLLLPVLSTILKSRTRTDTWKTS